MALLQRSYLTSMVFSWQHFLVCVAHTDNDNPGMSNVMSKNTFRHFSILLNEDLSVY